MDERLALVETLEKAKHRIAELEEAEQKLCAANVTLDARAELAERQLAELESRTVTVKLASRRLPSDYVDGEFGNDDWQQYIMRVVWNARSVLKSICQDMGL